MKSFWKLCAACLITVGLVSAASAVPVAEQWKGTTLRSPGHIHGDKASERFLAGNGWDYRAINADSSHSYDAQDLEIILEPDLESRVLAGSVTMTALSEVEELTEVDVHLEFATITTVEVNEVAAEYSYEDGVVLVTLSSAMGVGDEFTVSIEYTVPFRANNDYDGGFYFSGVSDVAYTFGEPYGTRRWLACYDLPFDKVTHTMSVILPEAYQVASNGAFVERADLGDGLFMTTYENTDPISTYLIAISASPYSFVEDDPAGANDTEIGYWVYPDDEADMVYDFGRTSEMLVLFESQFGEYPFAKYEQAVAPIFGGWGAMEHQGCTTYGSRLVGDGNRQFEGIVAHELGHQWFGDWVGPVDFRNIWLNEGFATYTEFLWSEYQSEAALQNNITNKRQSYFNEDANFRFPIYDPPYDPANGIDMLFSSTVYDKGGLILHMLRWVVGDEDFFAGMQLYGQNHAYGSANTAELQEDFETASGMDLSAFFDQWIYGQGFPVYQVGALETWEDDEFGNSASLTINQIQQNAPLFSTPLPVLLRSGALDTLVRVEVEAVDAQVVEIHNLDFMPTTFAFDPERTILCHYSLLNVDENPVIPSTYIVTEPWPNPFNAATNLRITLTRPSPVRMQVFDLLGRQVGVVERGVLSAGDHRINWQPGNELSSGLYLLKVKVGEQQTIRRATLVK
ncbi:T9SS type A sorting domain-containing protein [bacterium]|nr:T9SS type A sorting domain-containing protein [bacterium]